MQRAVTGCVSGTFHPPFQGPPRGESQGPAGVNSRGFLVELTPSDVVRVLEPTLVDVAT